MQESEASEIEKYLLFLITIISFLSFKKIFFYMKNVHNL